jgi:hypothetical protein
MFNHTPTHLQGLYPIKIWARLGQRGQTGSQWIKKRYLANFWTKCQFNPRSPSPVLKPPHERVTFHFSFDWCRLVLPQPPEMRYVVAKKNNTKMIIFTISGLGFSILYKCLLNAPNYIVISDPNSTLALYLNRIFCQSCLVQFFTRSKPDFFSTKVRKK